MSEKAKADNDGEAVSKVRELSGAAVAVNGQRLLARAANAQLAEQAIRASHASQVRRAAAVASEHEFLRSRAAEIVSATRKAAERGVRSGAREQVKGHFVEAMTIRDYNAAGRLTGKRMVGMPSPTHRAYDARRFIKGGGRWKYAGAGQVKSSSAGTEKAITQIEKVKAGSARNATLFVPGDEVAKSTRGAAGRIRVKGNGVTRKQSAKRLDGGLKDLANKGTSAGSKLRAASKTGAIGAATSVAIGAACEAKALRSGELSRRHYIENRGLDAVEGGTGALIGTAAASGGGIAATAGLGTAMGGSFVASAGAAGTAVLGGVGTLGAPGAAAAAALGGLSAPVVIPAAVATGASIAAGFAVSRAFKKARGKVEEGRRQSAEADERTEAEPAPSHRAEQRETSRRPDCEPRSRTGVESRGSRIEIEAR